MREILDQPNVRLPAGWRLALWVMVAVGALMFIVGLTTGAAQRTWEAFLINALFWGGLAQAGVMLSVIWQITDSRWGRPFKRLAEAYGAFLPVSFVMLVLVFFGAHYLYAWVEHPMPAKAGYLNLSFFAIRNVIGLGVLLVLTLSYLRNALKPDMALARQVVPGWGGSFADRLLKDYHDPEVEAPRIERRARRLAPVLGIVYAVVFTMVGFDYAMSLDQEWFSTLFGVYFFVGHLYSALALMLILAYFMRKRPGVPEYLTLNRLNDLAKLTFAIAMLYAYLAFSQYLVIWYSNLPEESPYLVTRSIAPTLWKPLFWTLVGVLFLFPFVGMMSRALSRKPLLMAVYGVILLVGQWWAHYLLVVPSIQDRHEVPHFYFGAYEILLTAGFAGMFFLSFFWFMSRVPVLPIGDKRLSKAWHGH